MKTRSQLPDVYVKDQVTYATGAVEPIAMFLRHAGERNIKLIFWYVAEVDESYAHESGTQTGGENYETRFVDADQVLDTLTYASDREVVAKALELYRATYPKS
jgi:hypothetical protein